MKQAWCLPTLGSMIIIFNNVEFDIIKQIIV